MRNRHHQAPGRGLVGVADEWHAALQRIAVAGALEQHALQGQALRGGRQHGTAGIHDQHRVEAVGLQLQACGFCFQFTAIMHTLAEQGGAVGHLLLR
ncbi:hypothetical protein D3C71_1041710 [compost metagenome]